MEKWDRLADWVVCYCPLVGCLGTVFRVTLSECIHTATWLNQGIYFVFLPSGTPPGSLEPTPSPSSTTCPPLPTPPVTNCNELLPSFDPDPADVALSSVPGQEAFDPRRHRFSEEELKPQPMIKKARKMLVPDDLKVRSSTQHRFMCSSHHI